MKLFLGFIGVCLTAISYGQYGEEVGPMTGNPALQAKGNHMAFKAAAGTFDSTFIYISDTIDLPVFDEFSTSKFQTYDADYSDPGVTFVKEYRLLDQTSQPLPDGVLYTQQQTFRRHVDLEALTTTDTPFDSDTIQLGDQTSYPTSYQTIEVYPPYYIYDTVLTTGSTDLDPDTVWIVGPEIYQDSATQFFAPINDLSAIWLDDVAYHNYSMAKDPWSLGVVTFDGLDEHGFPYAIGSTTTNWADHLTSKPIDMSVLSPADSIYFSFMYQAQGLCDAPENGDSLVLEFYAHDLMQWQHIWSTPGIALDTFRLAHIPVTDPDYFVNGFQFRFKNYGGLSGSLDHFHIDYVHLRSIPGFGGAQDTALRDIAFSYPVYTLLDEYTSVPWDHFKNLANPNDVMSTDMQVVMANSFPGDINANDGSVSIYNGGNLDGSVLLVSDILCDNVIDNYVGNSIPYSNHDIKSFYTFDNTLPGISQEFEIRTEATGGASNFAGNDSTITTQVFENYYSYDDGSAELAYGPTGAQSRLAIQYTTYEPDSVIGAMIHFVPSVNDVSNNLFLLTVWDDNNGEPGNVLYEDNLFFPRTPNYTYDQNVFGYYLLLDTMKLHVDGTFYIGWRQLEAERLNVGLDMNIANNQHTFYSNDGGNTWNQSQFEGSVMIRPIFSTGMDVTLGIKENSEMAQNDATVYPNPTNGTIQIDTSHPFEGAELYNMQGQLMMHSDVPSMDLTQLPEGIYLLKIEGVSEIHKIIRH